MATAKARHILVTSEDQCAEIKEQIIAGTDFADIARQYSTCPSGKQGGDLGEFGEVVFSGEVGKVHGPVKTQFGYHLLEITSRTD